MKPSELPLAAARERLRGKPGRPRKVGHTAGTPAPEGPAAGWPEPGAPARLACSPRLLDLSATADYLGVSPWTVRDLEAAGILKRVRIPLSDGRELRKLLFDRADLDRLVETWKE